MSGQCSDRRDENREVFLSMLTRLELEVPLGFEQALGCETTSTYIGIFWDDDDAEIVYDDGWWECAVDMDNWQSSARQPVITTMLRHFQHHFLERDTGCALLLDLTTRQLYFGQQEVVRITLGKHFTSSKGVLATAKDHKRLRRTPRLTQ